MATHLLWQADVADFDAWLKVFHDDKPTREAAGLIDMNVWQDPDQENHAVALFAVRDLDRARAFFNSEELAMHREREGVIHVTMKFLTPA